MMACTLKKKRSGKQNRCRRDRVPSGTGRKNWLRCGTGEYELRSHDSFKISEEHQPVALESQDIGGKSALDYPLSMWRAFPLQRRCGICWSRMRPHTSPCRKIRRTQAICPFLRRRVKNTGWSYYRCKAVGVTPGCDPATAYPEGSCTKKPAVSQLYVRRSQSEWRPALCRAACSTWRRAERVQRRTGGKRQTAFLLASRGGEKPACRSV